MHTVILFMSQKGGVGKSTLARAIAREAAFAGLNVKLADIDVQQATVSKWYQRRLAAKRAPIMSVEAFPDVAAALEGGALSDLLIIDAPARASAGTLAAARHSDIIVQPSGPCVDDLQPGVREFRALVNKGIPLHKLVFALNNVSTEREEANAREYIATAGFTALEGALPHQPAYHQAQDIGRAITETPFKSLNRLADIVVQKIIDRIGGEHG